MASERVTPPFEAESAATKSPVVDLEQEITHLHSLPRNSASRSTRVLVSLPGLKQVLVSMSAKSRWSEHSTAGRISIHVLRGQISVHALGKVFQLPAGHLLALDSNVAHDVEALEESMFLLTVAKELQPSFG